MLGQAEYIKQVFGGILDERCRLFLIKKCLPLLPTLGRYKNATELLLDLAKKSDCDWYAEFLEDLKSPSTSKPKNIEYTYPDVDMATYYRFAAFVASHIQKQKFDAKWGDGTFRAKIKDEKGKEPLGGEATAGEKAVQDWFIKILDGILNATFAAPGDFKTDTTWCNYYLDNPNSEIFDMDFFYGCGDCKKLPKDHDPTLLNPCCKYHDLVHVRIDSWGEINCKNYDDKVLPINAPFSAPEGTVNKLDWIKCSAQGVGTGDKLLEFLGTLTKEERCYICRDTLYMTDTEMLGDDKLTSIKDEIMDEFSGWIDGYGTAVMLLGCDDFPKEMKEDKCENLIPAKPLPPGKCHAASGKCLDGPDAGGPCTVFDGVTSGCGPKVPGAACAADNECQSGLCKQPVVPWDPNKDYGEMPSGPGKRCLASAKTTGYKPPCLDGSEAHYETYTRILDLMLYETVKSYLL